MGRKMPEICRFLGIIIVIYYSDHNPPHFHVKYNEHRASIDIKELRILEGSLPQRVLALVLEWAFLHRADLLADWVLAREGKPLNKIEPLT
jgi:hypothetical protein